MAYAAGTRSRHGADGRRGAVPQARRRRLRLNPSIAALRKARTTMSSLMSQLSPSITNMIRLDHTHVLTAFHQYETGASERLKRGLADNICLAIEIHAQLEEEIFYPALRVVLDNEMVRKSGPEHDEMRGLISRLRNLPVGDPAFDTTFFELVRHVMHHVADEETQLLPAAERLIPEQLQELGARMTRRRLELTGARAPEIVSSVARSASARTLVAAGSALLTGAYLLTRHRNGPRMWARRAGVVR
jgi:hypothetical protein